MLAFVLMMLGTITILAIQSTKTDKTGGKGVAGSSAAGNSTVHETQQTQNTALSEMECDGIAKDLRCHIGRLAGQIGERNWQKSANLTATADYIKKTFKDDNIPVSEHQFEVNGKKLSILSITFPGGKGRTAEQVLEDNQNRTSAHELIEKDRTIPVLIIATHYDSAPGSPGANGSASGVAAIIEMARMLKGRRFLREMDVIGRLPASDVDFVFFPNEAGTLPFVSTGSHQYAQLCTKRAKPLIGVLYINSIGFYSEDPGSQRFPTPDAAKANTGNFVAFLSTDQSKHLLQSCINAFKKHTNVPCEELSAAGMITKMGDSVQHNFQNINCPCVIVTDTGAYRYPDDHKSTDTPDKVVYDKTARVVAGLTSVTDELSQSFTGLATSATNFENRAIKKQEH